YRHSITISDVVLDKIGHVFDMSGTSSGRRASDGYTPTGEPLVCGFTVDGLKATNLSNPYTDIGGLLDCTFRNISIEGQVNIKGFVPYTGPVDATNDDGSPFFPPNNCTFENFTAQFINITGLKGSYFNDLRSENSPGVGIQFVSCADIAFG